MASPSPFPNERYQYPADSDYKRQSVEVPGTRRPGQTGHYRSSAFGLHDLSTPGVLTDVAHMFNLGHARSTHKKFLGRRPVLSTNPLKLADYYEWITYDEAKQRMYNIGSQLTNLFANGTLKGAEVEAVGLWSINRPEWQLVDLGSQIFGKVTVSLYDTLGKDSVEYIINHSSLSVIFATANHIPDLLKMAKKVPCLKLIVSLDVLSPEAQQIATTWAEAQGIVVIDINQFEAAGAAQRVEPPKVTPTTIATICYTSGTTGNPKGAVLTHGNLATATHAQLVGSPVREGSTLSYLPLAHIYERMTELTVLSIGASIGFYSGDPLRLLEDAQVLKPKLFASVPRVLNRIYQSAMVAGGAPGLKGALFRRALAVKIAKLHETGEHSHPVWDRLVFRKVKAVLGGELVIIASGSAPIPAEVMDFLRVAFYCDIVEGYGMTENVGTCTRVWPNDPTSSGTVGPPVSAIELKLVDVPAMGYGAEDKPHPRGEICCRGPCSFSTYFKDEKNTKSTVDEEGWVHTGDVGLIDECGRLKIIDRVKNIMKLSQGEYVALEKIENTYSSHPLVQQLYVHGDSLQPYLLAVIVPDPLQLAAIASRVYKTNVAPEDNATLLKASQNPQVVQEILAALTKAAHKNHLKGFETIRRIHVSLDPFSIENGLLTPTFKTKRKEAYIFYKKELDALYALGEPAPAVPRTTPPKL